MATLTDLAQSALRELYILSAAEVAASEDQFVADRAVLDLVEVLPEFGAGRGLVDVETVDGMAAGSDERVICLSGGIAVFAPSSPEEGCRFAVSLVGAASVLVSAPRRKIEGGTVPLTVTESTTWAYRKDLSDWCKVTGLVPSDQSPWPAWCDAAISLLAAERIAGPMERQITPDLRVRIERAHEMMRLKFSRPKELRSTLALPASVMGRVRR